MYLFYVDESGNTGADLEDEQDPVHWLVALGVRGAEVMSLEAAIREVGTQYCFPTSTRPHFEFHGGHIFHGRGDFLDMPPADRVALYRDLLALLDEHDCYLVVRGIHKGRHAARAAREGYQPDHPHKLGFMYLMERVDEWLERRQPDPPAEPEHGLVVADVQREVNRDLIERFPQWRNWGTDHGYRTREIEFLIDTIHTVPSHDSWLIQLADCVAYIRNRYYKIDQAKREEVGGTWLLDPERHLTESEAAVRQLWVEDCGPCVVSHRVWPRPTPVIET